jgi:MFS family permease
VISDISTPEERGGFFGLFILGPMVGPAIGPVIGGALAQGLGWRFVNQAHTLTINLIKFQDRFSGFCV